MACANDGNEKMQIYHLAPDNIITRSSNEAGEYAIQRDDFFVVKNFKSDNEEQEKEMDAFVVAYLAHDDFLKKNRNASLTLTFYRYGDGITEQTKHTFDTDYTMHTLFSLDKRVAVYSFDTNTGYLETLFIKDGKSVDGYGNKRTIITDFLKK